MGGRGEDAGDWERQKYYSSGLDIPVCNNLDCKTEVPPPTRSLLAPLDLSSQILLTGTLTPASRHERPGLGLGKRRI